MIDRRLPSVHKLIKHLESTYSDWPRPVAIEAPPDLPETRDFDLAIPCFSLSKLRRKPPQAIAEEIAESLRQQADLEIERVLVIKAFVNIAFRSSVLGRELSSRRHQILGDAAQSLKSEKFVVEFSSPNIAKPFGIGHLRSTNIGAAISRILVALGADVIRINHLGDWGTQFGKVMTAYKRYGNAEFVKGDPVNNLYRLYVEFHEKEKDDPALLDEAREWFARLEKGDPEARELWTWFKDLSYHEFSRIYNRLGVKFDYVTGESFYEDLMPKTIERLKTKGLLKASEGAQIVDLESVGLPPCLVQKSDGSTLYATRDLATAEYRAKTFSPTQFVYVVGAEQTLHFQQIFSVLKAMGYAWADRCVHVGFGLIRFPEGKMSTRKGNIVLLEQVLDQAEAEILRLMETKEAEKPEAQRLSEAEKREVAELVGAGSVVFFDLHAKRTKDIPFDWKAILNFEGDSGPYLQYSVVRLKSLLEKAGRGDFEKALPQLPTFEERHLARSLLHFPARVEIAAREFEPSTIAHTLLEIAASFNRFYMNVSVLKGEEEYREGRLALVAMTKQVMEFGLNLLGIRCPSKM